MAGARRDSHSCMGIRSGGRKADLPGYYPECYSTGMQLWLTALLLDKPATRREGFAWRNEYGITGLFQVQVAG